MKNLFLFIFFILTLFSHAQIWSPVGTGTNQVVSSLMVHNGELYAGGNFTVVDGTPIDLFAKWNEISWSPIGTGANNAGGGIVTTTVYNSDIYVGGGFMDMDGVSARNIGKWNGISWSGLGSGTSSVGGPDFVTALYVYNNELYVGGYFTLMNNIQVYRIAKWNGTSWSTVGSGMNGGQSCNTCYVSAFMAFNGELYAGGIFSIAGGVPANNIAKWNGTSWSAVGGGINGPVSSLIIYNGELYVGGSFNAGSANPNQVVKWNGSAWIAVGTGMNGSVNALAVYGNALYAGGQFTMADGAPAAHIARWNGTSWDPLGAGIDNTVKTLCVYNNALYAGGLFTSAGGNPANNIAKWSEPVGISEAENNDFNISPNPVNNKIQLNSFAFKTKEILLLNVEGKIIKRSTENISELDVSDLPSGFYFLKLLGDSKVVNKKIVVQH
ncbi:MAG: hypothetical protein K0Q95_1097 [Bacteroidota bacterium]|jgi:hypothetical protein|nr:hypothetical protein [Bacteroidota bacterium]